MIIAAFYILIHALLLLLLKDIGNARLGESDQHPISPKTPTPQHQPKKERRERENSRRQKVSEQLGQ